MTEVELYRTVTACRALLRESVRAALAVAQGDPEIVRAAVEAELACHRARAELTEAA